MNDKIAYFDSIISLPNDSIFNLSLFKEIPTYKIFKPFQEYSNKISFGYRGNIDSINISVENKDLKGVLTKEKYKDTLHYWFKDIEFDSLHFKIENKDTINYFKIPKRF